MTHSPRARVSLRTNDAIDRPVGRPMVGAERLSHLNDESTGVLPWANGVRFTSAALAGSF